jgi:hypothetical protein
VSSPNKRRLKLQEMREQATEALGMEPGMDLELDDGSVVTIPNPLFVSEETQVQIEAATGAVSSAKAVLGDEEHARLIAGGGTSNDVMMAWRLLAEDMASTPKLPR